MSFIIVLNVYPVLTQIITGVNSWDHDPKDHDLDHGHDLKSVIWTMIHCHDPWSWSGTFSWSAMIQSLYFSILSFFKTWGDMDHRIMIHEHDPSHVNSYDPWSWSWKLVWWGPWIMILIWPLCPIGSWSSKVHGHDPETPWVPTCDNQE